MFLEPSLQDHLRSGKPIIDVRAPVEFVQGSIPGSINLPLLNDEERKQVGTCYKQQGKTQAIELGHQLISGDIKKKRIQAWKDFARLHPDAIITCLRGGLRSQISQQWLAEAGINLERISGGYKKTRNLLLTGVEDFFNKARFCVVSGPTGSGKTHLLKELSQDLAVIDLESLAKHRGSAFGASHEDQPSQANFENQLGLSILRLPRSAASLCLIEDESRMIGKIIVPLSVNNARQTSPMVLLKENLEDRVERIFQDYISPELKPATFERYQAALQKISKKLGGVRSLETQLLMNHAWEIQQNLGKLHAHRDWIRFLLENYYDPLYQRSLSRYQRKVLFQGNYKEVRDFILSQLRPQYPGLCLQDPSLALGSDKNTSPAFESPHANTC